MKKNLILILAMPGLFLGCSKDSRAPKPDSGYISTLFRTKESNQISVRSIDDQPLAGARILIGDALNDPFADNFLTANESGQVQVPSAWTSPLTITVQAPGYIRSTYINQTPGALTLKLRPMMTKIQNEVRGGTSGLPIADKDGWVDFGLVMSAFTRFDLLAFDINRVISPQSDRITAMGQDIDIPSNISLPRQSERYGIFTITMDKPIYRIYFGNAGIQRVFAARGRFPFKSTVDAMRGGTEFYDLINDFKINGGSIRDIDVKPGQNKLEMPTTELNFTETKGLVAPSFRGDEIFMAVGLINQSGYLIPTDVKKAEQSKKLSLNSLPGADQYILSVLKKSAEMKAGGGRMSTSLIPLISGITPTLLPLIPDPKIAGDELILPQFNSVDGVNPLATYSVLSKEEEVIQGSAKVKVMSAEWEVYAPNWLDRIKIPRWPQDGSSLGRKRWEVNFVGSQTASQAPMGPAIIEAATHVTHSSVTF